MPSNIWLLKWFSLRWRKGELFWNKRNKTLKFGSPLIEANTASFREFRIKQNEIEMLGCQDWSLDGAVLTIPLYCMRSMFPSQVTKRLVEDGHLKGRSVHLSEPIISSEIQVLYLLNWNSLRVLLLLLNFTLRLCHSCSLGQSVPANVHNCLQQPPATKHQSYFYICDHIGCCCCSKN